MLHYDEYGDKADPTILLLHGAGMLDTFCGQYCFSDRYHLVVPHLPGAGTAAAEVYEPEKTIEDLLALIRSLHKEKIGVIGHSLGAQIAIMLINRQPGSFYFAIFLSAWVDPRPGRIRMYCSLAGASAKILHWKWLVRLQARYWKLTAAQTDIMARYAGRITAQVYRSFFAHTLDLSKLPAYQTVTIPMFAICGSREVRDMKTSLTLLAQNPNCQILTLRGAGHDFPMRKAAQLNPILQKFILNVL